MKIVAGEGKKKKSEILGGPADGLSRGGGRSCKGGVLGRGKRKTYLKRPNTNGSNQSFKGGFKPNPLWFQGFQTDANYLFLDNRGMKSNLNAAVNKTRMHELCMHCDHEKKHKRQRTTNSV